MRKDVGRCYDKFIINGNMIQTDWDYPSEASALGWSLRRVQVRKGRAVHFSRVSKGCDHPSTDGTITCSECGITATSFITAASEYLDSLC